MYEHVYYMYIYHSTPPTLLPFFQIEANLGISLDNQSPPVLPEYMPPMMLLVPWVLKVGEREGGQGWWLMYLHMCGCVVGMVVE